VSFALSTSWNARLHDKAVDIVNEVKALGLDEVELNFGLTAEMVAGFLELKEKGEISIVSTHNFCPIPNELTPQDASPDYFSLTSLDDSERSLAIHYTQRTIQTAAALGAGAVVLHCGKVTGEDKIRSLMAIYDKNGFGTPEYNALKDKMAKERSLKKDQHFAQLLLSMEELLKTAQDNKIKLGIENRFYYLEMPTVDEIAYLLDKFDNEYIGYWHDVGHAQLFENLGFLKHMDYLEKLGNRLVGVHLHDVKGTQDHMAPGTGDFDFSLLKPYIKPDTIKVIEAHQPATADEIKNAVDLLNKIF